MASRRSHAPTNNQQIEYELWGSWYKVTYYSSAKRDLFMKPTASCEAAQLWVRAKPPPKYSSPKGDRRFPYDVEEDSRSRFAEPREGGEDCLSHSCAPSELAVGF